MGDALKLLIFVLARSVDTIQTPNTNCRWSCFMKFAVTIICWPNSLLAAISSINGIHVFHIFTLDSHIMLERFWRKNVGGLSLNSKIWHLVCSGPQPVRHPTTGLPMPQRYIYELAPESEYTAFHLIQLFNIDRRTVIVRNASKFRFVNAWDCTISSLVITKCMSDWLTYPWRSNLLLIMINKIRYYNVCQKFRKVVPIDSDFRT